MTPRRFPPPAGLVAAILWALPARASTPGENESPARPAIPRAPSALELAGQPPSRLLAIGRRALDGDPALAFAAYRALSLQSAERPATRRAARHGLGRCWLSVGHAEFALRYARSLVAEDPTDPAARTLEVRALLRGGAFHEALDAALRAAARIGLDDAELRAAHASAMFRNQRLAEAERGYREVLAGNPTHVEALVRLGSGLLPPRPASVTPDLSQAVASLRNGRLDRARVELGRVLGHDPRHPIALRILGELFVTIQRERSPLVAGGFFERYWSELAPSAELPVPVRRMFPDFAALSATRRRMIAWSALPWRAELTRVATLGGRHDILMECERTTDDEARRWLRGKRTFDGRVWDDVRGIGGLCAATGVEALDDAHDGGFQTLVHELAHQVHMYAMSEGQRGRITELYARAKAHGRCLDYYAASNEAEYFAQGVEAWFSLAKAAGQVVTHGHTRFELARRDPALHAFIASLVERDPLQRARAAGLLPQLVDAAIRAGRAADARAVLELLPAAAREAPGRRVARAEVRFETL